MSALASLDREHVAIVLARDLLDCAVFTRVCTDYLRGPFPTILQVEGELPWVNYGHPHLNGFWRPFENLDDAALLETRAIAKFGWAKYHAALVSVVGPTSHAQVCAAAHDRSLACYICLEVNR